VLITFDEGSRDFLTYAWPLLKRYGFSATVFLYTDEIGQSKIQHRVCGGEISPFSWTEMRQLQSEGVTFGSHSSSRRELISLSFREVIREVKQSRETLQNELAIPVSTFAYPLGKVNRMIQYLIGACGYNFGLSCNLGLCTMNDSLLALPRIKVEGSDTLETFAAKLGSLTPVVKVQQCCSDMRR
jgi:peptidoglycan/xylan/chitin deacetylase (PgdA/CDA1 family)